MISPQEPGNEFYYPAAGTTRISYTHPSVTSHFWRHKIADAIEAQAGMIPQSEVEFIRGLMHAARIARGGK